MTLAQLRQRLVDAMEQRGDWPAGSPWIRDAVTALPRDAVAPDRLYDWDGHTYRPVDRATDPDRWARLLFADQDSPAITQVTDGLPTSSLSSQAVVVDMLDSLMLEPGHGVLELGTGAGWNAGLLAWRAGPNTVTSIEVDPGLAREALRRTDGIAVRCGDGAFGYPAHAPYDRVISTYAVERVPWAWVEQTRPGGRIVTPWGHLGHVALTVDDDHRSATGRFQGLAQFMPSRSAAAARTYQQIRDAHPDVQQHSSRLDPAALHNDWHLLMALRVAVPDVRISTRAEGDGVTAWAHDGSSSWARLADNAAEEGGPRHLADELEAAGEQWLRIGSPQLYDYGMTVTPDQQYLWLGDPASGLRWPG